MTAARERPVDSIELVLAELWAMRHVLLNLFYAGVQGASQWAAITPESILRIRDRSDASKLEEARKILGKFLEGAVRSEGDRS